MKPLTPLILLACLTGCTPRAELIAVREGMHAAADPLLRQSIELRRQIVAGDVPALTQRDVDAAAENYRVYAEIVTQSRAQD
jgi:hypothetical protein